MVGRPCVVTSLRKQTLILKNLWIVVLRMAEIEGERRGKREKEREGGIEERRKEGKEEGKEVNEKVNTQ